MGCARTGECHQEQAIMRDPTPKVKDIWQLSRTQTKTTTVSEEEAGGEGEQGNAEEDQENLRSYKSKLRNKDTNSICAS